MKDSKRAEIRRENPDAADAGRFLANRRKRARITQADIASKIGRSRKWVSEFERGRRAGVPFTDVIAFANAVGFSVGFFDLPETLPDGETLTDIRDNGERDTFTEMAEDPDSNAEIKNGETL